MTRRLFTALLFSGLCICTAAATPDTGHAQRPAEPVATIQDLMMAEIDPSADALWDAVAFISSRAGTTDRHPRTKAQWQALRLKALMLIEATTLLTVEGRQVSTPTSGQRSPDQLNPAEIRRRIAATRSNFVAFSLALRTAAMRALAAIDARDPQALLDSGGPIDEACEACHTVYWYPPNH